MTRLQQQVITLVKLEEGFKEQVRKLRFPNNRFKVHAQAAEIPWHALATRRRRYQREQLRHLMVTQRQRKG